MKNIVPFLRTTYIINKNDTKAEQDKCEENYEILLVEIKTTIRSFYMHAGNTFMTKVEKLYKEIFYMRALRHYKTLHAKREWDTYKLGVGIFRMEGFERINLESKQVVRNHTNKKGNITLQSAIFL